MLPDLFPLQCEDGARPRGKIIIQEIAEIAFPDETDARAVLLFGGGEAVPFGEGAHLRFQQFPQGEQNPFELLLRDLIEKIGLVFVRVRRL